jgi:ribulose-5-phosphate 4-epimerase/fuculose-1-phosphate aldolase
MNYTDFRRHIGKAGLTVNAYAALLGIRPNSLSYYAKKGAIPHPHAIIAVLAGDAADRGVDFRELLRRHGVFTAGSKTVAGAVMQIDDYRHRESRDKKPA